MYVYLSVWVPSGTRGTQSPGAAVISSGELPHVGAGNSGPLREEHVPLTAESSLQPQGTLQ